jgi:hypothetical protein
MLPFRFGALRSGKVHSAAGWRAVLEPVIARYRDTGKRLYSGATRPLPILRCTNFTNPEMYEFLEAERASYSIRLPASRVLQDRIGYPLKRPVGRPAA